MYFSNDGKNPKQILYQDLDSGMQGMFFSLYIFPVHSCLPPYGVRGIALTRGDTVGQKQKSFGIPFLLQPFEPC